MSNSTTIMLLPDSTYKAARPKVTDAHLTIAMFDTPADQLASADLLRLRQYVNMVTRFEVPGPIPAKANGIGIFGNGQDGVAVVDLIDGIGTFRIRAGIEKFFGPGRMGYENDPLKINYTHGFTPHMTREYLNAEDDYYGEITPDMIDGLEFNFVAIGVWSGDQRWEVAL